MTSAPEGRTPRSSEEASEVVEGVVARVTYESDDSSFRVIKVRPHAAAARKAHARAPSMFDEPRRSADESELVTVVGRFPAVARGESIRAIGRFERDARHGEQLRADVVSVASPTTPAGIARYLAGGIVKGIGQRTAEKIVKTFGDRTIHVLDSEPERLAEVRGLSAARAKLLAEAWRSQRAVRELMVVLASLGVPPSVAQKIHKRYRDEALDVVRRTPYRLALEVWGVGFKSADAIAQKVGVGKDDPQRAQAGLLHVLQTFADEGHTATPRGALLDRTARLLQAPEDGASDEGALLDVADVARVTDALVVLLGAGLVIEEEEGVAHAPMAAHERALAGAIARLLAPARARVLQGVDAAVESFERATGISLAPAQRLAIETIARAPFVVVTGGPGVGKTTVVRAILALFEASKLRTVLAAPTGRAAKRMAESTGKAASTIHRLLEVDPRRGGFARDEEHPLELGALVVDEASMVDVPLAHALLRATPSSARVVLVGDVDQLPSIGPGAVLRDVIDSGAVPTVRLTEVFRQASASAIIAGAHAILRGHEPTPSRATAHGEPATSAKGELFLVERADPEGAAQTIVDVVATRIPRAFSLDPRKDVQVLVPMVRGSVGTRALNAELQARLNPSGAPAGTRRGGGPGFRVGDRVMQMKNDYERNVFNGDLGHVASVDDATSEDEGGARMVVRLEDGRDVVYEDDDLDELALAYACTIHKAQGSEYPAVVIGLVNQHYVMLARKLLYTAVTRARQLVVIVGSRWALREAIRDARGEERRTMLRRRLRDGI